MTQKIYQGFIYEQDPASGDWVQKGPASQANTPTPAPRAPGFIMGRPDPIKQAQELRAQQDQQMQASNFDYQRQRDARQDALRAQDREDKLAKDQRDLEKSEKTTESEKKAAFLTTRLANGLSQMTSVIKETPDAAKPELGGELLRRIAGDGPANFLISGPRQQVEAAQLEILDSALTLGTGAAYTKEQIDGYRKSYFPQGGDSEQTVKDKQKRLQGVLEAARLAAGRAAPQIDDAMRLAGFGVVEQHHEPNLGVEYKDVRTVAQSWGEPDQIIGARMTPEQEAGANALLQAYGKNVTPEILQEYYQRIGWNIPHDNAKEVVDYYLKKGKGVGTSYERADANARARAEAELQKRLEAEGMTAGEIGTTALREQGISYNLSDEFYGLAGGARGLFNGKGFVQGYEDERDVQRLITEKARENHGLAPEIISSIFAPGGIGTSAARGGNVVRAGVAQGALAGFGAGEGDFGSQLGSTALGTGLGFVGGKAVERASPYVGNALSRFVNRPRQSDAGAIAAAEARDAVDIIGAGARQGIPIRQPDARPSTRADFAAAEVSTGGNPIITRTLQQDSQAVQRRLNEIAGNGAPQENYPAGSMIQGAVRRQTARSRAQNTRNYNQAKALAGDAQVSPQQTSALIDEHIAGLQAAAPEGSSAEVAILESVKRDLQATGLTIDSLQAQRKALRGRVNVTGVDADATQRRLMEVLDEAGTELEIGLRQANPKAAKALAKANTQYREYKTFRNEIAKMFEGTANNPLSTEQAAQRFFTMFKAGGDSEKAARALKMMSPDERLDLSATIVAKLGQSGNGEFSLAALAKNIGDGTTRQGANHRALMEMFGPDGYRALQDIQVIARAKADTFGALNHSRTAAATERSTVKSIIGAALGGSIGSIPGAVAGAVGTRAVSNLSSQRTAKLLLNPDFTKWLRRAPSSNNPRVITGYMRRLDSIAARQPALATDIRGLQQMVIEQVNRSPSSVMAEGQQPDNRR